MGIGLANYVYWSTGGVTYVSKVAKAFIDRVVADGGTVESKACLISALTYLNPVKPVPLSGYLLTDYSGAAAAYSLRLLRDIYVGSAIRVRRASDNTERNIGFVNNELDTASLETFCSGTNGFVTTWYDQSGNAANAANATAAEQPKIVASGSTILENGKPTIEFNSSFLNASTINIPQPTSYFITYKYAYLGNDSFSDLSDGTSRQLNDTTSSGKARAFSGHSFISNLSTSTNQTLRFSLFNGLDSGLALNNSAIQIGNAGTGAIQNLVVGKSNALRLSGNIQEFIIYPTDESSNRSGIDININTHYSIY